MTLQQHDRDLDREPTPDERAGMSWWNAMTEAQRPDALRRAGASTVAEAWAYHKQQGEPAAP